MDFGQYEESLLKSHSKQTDHRDWMTVLWVIVSVPLIIFASRLHPGDSKILLLLTLGSQALTLIAALVDKSVYIHFISLMIHSKPGVDLQKWVRINARLSIVTVILSTLNILLSSVYLYLVTCR